MKHDFVGQVTEIRRQPASAVPHQGRRSTVNSRRLRVIVAACAMVILVQGTLHTQDWYVNYEKGLDAFRNQQWQAAVQSLSEAIADQSDSKANKRMPGLQFVDYFPYVYRGVAYFKLGDRTKALTDLEKAEGEKEVQDGTKDLEAAKLLRDHLALLRKSAVPQTDARFAEGKKLYDQREYRKAIEQFDSVPEDSPQHAEALRYKGRAEKELRDLEAKGKRDRLDKALADGKRYLNQKDLNNAETQFNEVLAIDPNHRAARTYLNTITTMRQKSAAPPPVAAQKEPVRDQPRIVTGPPPDTT